MKKKIIATIIVIAFCIGLFSLTSIMQKKYTNKLEKNVVTTTKSKNNAKKDSSSENNKKVTNSDIKGSATSNSTGTAQTDSSSNNKAKAQASRSNSTVSSQTNKTGNSSQTQSQSGSRTKTSESSPSSVVSLTVVDEVSGGTILSYHGSFSSKDAGTVTEEILNAKGINYRATGSGSSIYFSSIAGKRERDAGAASGWVYYVNGSKPQVGCGQYTIKSGDTIVWKYVKDGLSE